MSTNHGEDVGQHSLRSLKLVKEEGEEQRQQQALGDEEYEEQNQHDDGPRRRQGGHLNMDRMKRTMNDKISMMMAPADVNEGTDYGQKEEDSE